MKKLITICSEKKNILVSIVALMLLLTATQYGLADTIYNDGGIHNINTTMPSGTVGVQNATTVNVLSGGNINGGNQTWAYGINCNASFVNIYSGSSITGGTSSNCSDGIRTYSNSLINIYGGSITGGNGGWADGIIVNDNSIMNIYGGSITGGNGVWADGIIVYNGTVVNIYGGSIAAGSGNRCRGLEAFGGSVNIYGTNFNYSLGPISAYSGTLTGKLADGTSLNVTFYQQSLGEIVLSPIPEPATICLLGLGALRLIKRKK